MDHSSVHSELIASLNYLRPPVKRTYANRKRELFHFYNFEPSKSRYSRNQFFRKLLFSPPYQSGDESSTSLILKKITRKEIFQRYAILTNTDRQSSIPQTNQPPRTHKEKPTINVTVVPNIKRTQSPILHRRRKQKSKINHNTLSNQNNFYLVVPSKEKVYKLKATGSLKLLKNYSTNKISDGNFSDQLKNLKQVFNSLDMDKKSRPDKNNRMFPPARGSDNAENRGDKFFRECFCPSRNIKKNNTTDVNSNVSRVRITGRTRLGLTDNLYVLNCAATVNDEPVATNLTPDRSLSPSFMMRTPNTDLLVQGKNDYQVKTNNRYRYLDINDDAELPLPSKVSQGTQVNFDIGFTSNNMFSKNEKVQYIHDNMYLKDAINTNVYLDRHNEDDDLKRCQSPFIIISVFPKNDEKIQISQNSVVNNRPVSTKQINTSTQNEKPTVRTGRQNRDRNNRSPNRTLSPPRNKSANVKDNNTIGTQSINKVTSKNKEQTSSNNDQKIKQPRVLKQDKSNSYKKDCMDKKCRKLLTQQGNTQISTGINTEHMLAKKTLVDAYTKQITKQMNKSARGASNNNTKAHDSKVIVNIASEHECYDLLFQEGDRTTDLKVRRTLKGPFQNKKYGNATYRRDSPASDSGNTNYIDQEHDVDSLIMRSIYVSSPMSMLNVQDSLEISHRREERSGQNVNIHINSNQLQEKPKDNLEPSGHFLGDDCDITNPVVRDKEIRELLGIGKTRVSKSQKKIKSDNNGLFVSHSNNGSLCGKNLVVSGLDPLKAININGHGAEWPEAQQPNRIADVKHDTNNKYIGTTYTANNYSKKMNEDHDSKNTNKRKETNDIYKSNNTYYMKSTKTEYHHTKTIKQEKPHQQINQIILSQNIKLFVQTKKCTKQGPIMLSRKQYRRVKRFIDYTMSKKLYQRKLCICKCNLSVENVRKKTKSNELQQPVQDCKSIQTSKKWPAMKNKQLKSSTTIMQSSMIVEQSSQESLTEHFKTGTIFEPRRTVLENQITTMLFSREARNSSMSRPDAHVPALLNNFAHTKHIMFSSTKVAAGTSNYPTRADSCSLHTLFRENRKFATPNLGTSIFSLYPKNNNDYLSRHLAFHKDPKPRKPFLKRLMSCLILRAKRESEFRIPAEPVPQTGSYNGSIDSYHINTSLGGIDMTSSIFDTSASFCSNHSVLPIRKLKRGFFSSVRSFLTNRKG